MLTEDLDTIFENTVKGIVPNAKKKTFVVLVEVMVELYEKKQAASMKTIRYWLPNRITLRAFYDKYPVSFITRCIKSFQEYAEKRNLCPDAFIGKRFMKHSELYLRA